MLTVIRPPHAGHVSGALTWGLDGIACCIDMGYPQTTRFEDKEPFGSSTSLWIGGHLLGHLYLPQFCDSILTESRQKRNRDFGVSPPVFTGPFVIV